jgi:omega-amidase
VGGSVAVHENGRYFNRFMLALPEGPTYWYDKRHLFRMGGEHRHYSAGTHALIIEWRGLRLCPLVCYDLRFPVWSRRRPELDYDLVIYCANWPAPRRTAWNALLRARAIENQAYCVGVNRVGSDGAGNAYVGDSVALDFMGQALVDLMDGTQVITVPLDPEALRAWRDKFPAHLDADAFSLE